jgi:chromosomal replication initiator protein
VLGYARAHNCPLTLETAQVALKDILDQSAARQITIEVIQKTTAAHYGIRLADLVSPKRSKMIALSRQVAMYLAREFTQLSLIDIGDSFGGRDHSTVLHACKKVRDMLSETPQFAKDVDAITKQLKST